MFKRRQPLKPMQILREILWPSMGWRRAARYVYLRLVRLSDSSHKIALGLAIGAGISFSPLLGTHFIQAGFLAYVLRVNILSALIGTFIGNPWTFPFIWWASIKLGAWIVGVFGLSVSTSLPETMDFMAILDIAIHHPFRLFLPWMLGGHILILMMVPVFYVPSYYFIRAAKAARTRARLSAIHRVAGEVTSLEPAE